MCGICGVAGRSIAQPLRDDQLRAMTDVITHRGPDEDGLRCAPGVALGMRRLSIIDLAGSSQPIGNEDGSVWTVFNGEIFNYAELRRDLERRGHRLATEGDTETIVHLYEDHGPAFVDYLRGMFAIAVWDAPRRRLVLARDRMGVKPLYLAEGEHGIAFASEVKSLIAGAIVRPALDAEAAELFLAHGYVPGPRTLFKGVRKLMPASLLVFEDGRVSAERTYWDPWSSRPPDVGRDRGQDRERLLALLRASVEARMVSDVPLGVMLSGGLDSSLITALMKQADRGPVRTFSIGFAEDAGSNELPDARMVAGRLGTEHHELETSAVDHPDLLDDVLWHLEEPIADLSSIGFLLLSRLAREHVTVALSGQGADELLGGYRKHQIAAAANRVQHVPAPLRRALLAASRRAPAGSTAARGLKAMATADPVDRLLAMSRVFEPRDRERFLTPEFRLRDAEAIVRDSIAQHADLPELSPLGQTLALDRQLALVDNMLLYFDKVSMAASLEVRVPFMDHDLVAFCAALPDDRLVRRTRKEILKDASRGLIPDEVIDKKKRGFFHSALGTWLQVHRKDLFEDVLLDPRTAERGQIDVAAVRPLVAHSGEEGKKNAQRLFSLLLLELWQRRFVDGGGVQAQPPRRATVV